jgi:hypothetical protein
MIERPMQFDEAILYLLEKEPNPQKWSARQWALRGADVRTRAFFSARVENARFLDRAQGLLFDFLTNATEKVVGPDNVQRTAIKVGSRAEFVRRMRDFMVREGMATEGEMRATNQEDLTDIKSSERLRLIFDTNVRQAYGFGQWKRGMEPAALQAYPAARLIRERNVFEPRPRHAANLGQVRLKTDPWWADYINDEEIGGFGVPWGPYGFNSGCNQEDVSRSEARRLGLDVRSVRPETRELNDGLKASTKGMDPAVKARLREALERSRASRKGNRTPEEAAREAAARARQRAARRQGGPQFRDAGDEISLGHTDA